MSEPDRVAAVAGTQATCARFLHGKTALVTGSGRNIGRAIALGFAAAGANVAINGRTDLAAAERVAAEARTHGVAALAVLADVADAGAVLRMVQEAGRALGTIDIAVANVGVREVRGLLDITPERWRAVIETNLSAAFYLARAVLPGMRSRGWGRIIHIAGRSGFFPKENRAHVSTSKAGMHALAKAIAIEFGPYGITANTIAPGVIDTERSDATHPGYAADFAQRSRAMPVRRLGTTDDIAALCLYLVSDAGGYMTGQVCHVNGGEFMS